MYRAKILNNLWLLSIFYNTFNSLRSTTGLTLKIYPINSPSIAITLVQVNAISHPDSRNSFRNSFLICSFILIYYKSIVYSQSYGFSSSHVQMWELDHKEHWKLMSKNWCFQIVVLEKTLESHLNEPQGCQTNQSWRKSTLNIHWKNWCWSSNTLASWFKELTH